jgi:hypothetical protein
VTARAPVGCPDFEAEVDELAVGAVAEPRRSALLAHAATCASCGERLRDLADLADRLLLLAPSAEPPPGFESRVLQRLAATGGSWTDHRRRFLLLVAAAALVLGVFAGTVVEQVRGRPSGPADVATADIVSGEGAVVGEVRLVTDPEPHVLVSIAQPRPSPGRRGCELVLADGSRVRVGSWAYDDVEHGVWAAGIDGELLEAVAMRVVDDDGRVIARVIATARFG